MSLTKTQTAILCLAAAFLPIGYEWHSLGVTSSESDQLDGRASRLQSEVSRQEQELAGLRHQLNGAEANLAAARSSLGIPASKEGQPATDAFVWSSQSPYVRLPIQVLPKLKLGEFRDYPRMDGSTNRMQVPPLAPNGVPQRALLAALGLDPSDAKQFSELCQDFFGKFEAAMAAHSTLERAPWPANGTPRGEAITVKTARFAEEGQSLRDEFQARAGDLLGQERFEAFWAQAAPVFRDTLNEFGSEPRETKAVWNGNRIDIFNMFKGSGQVRELSDPGSPPLPLPLRPYVNEWVQKMAKQ